MFGRNPAADSALLDFAWYQWDRSGTSDGDIGEPPDFRRFNSALAELHWLATFLQAAADDVEQQSGPWRQSEQRNERIQRAQYLAPVFEAAFDAKVSANNWPSDPRHTSPTAFMDFYQRMVALAFQERATPDVSGVIKAAQKLHKESPVRFAEGVIPGL